MGGDAWMIPSISKTMYQTRGVNWVILTNYAGRNPEETPGGIRQFAGTSVS